MYPSAPEEDRKICKGSDAVNNISTVFFTCPRRHRTIWNGDLYTFMSRSAQGLDGLFYRTFAGRGSFHKIVFAQLSELFCCILEQAQVKLLMCNTQTSVLPVAQPSGTAEVLDGMRHLIGRQPRELPVRYPQPFCGVSADLYTTSKPFTYRPSGPVTA